MNPPKVFEYAKTIGMETLGLMDKLREWKIPVKSHMAELDNDTLSLIQTKLSEEKVKKETSTKKGAKVAKKAVAAAAATAAEKPQPAKKAAPKKAASAEAAPAKKTTAATKKGATAAGAAKVVLRRAADVVVAPPVEEVEAPTPVVAAPEVVEEVTPEANAPVEVEAKQAQTHVQDQTAIAQPAQSAAPAVPAAAAPAAGAQAPLAVPAVGTSTAQTPSAAGIARPDPSKPVRSVKREVVIGAGARSNIVGRIDLNRAREAGRTSQQRPTGGQGYGGGGGGGAGAGPGARPMTSGARGMRTGFMAAPSATPQPFEEANRRDHTKRKPRVAQGEEPAAVKEEEQEQFTATEFRKREMIFQPKKKKGVLGRPSMKTEITKARASKRVVRIHDKIKVSEFAAEMGVKVSQITANLMKQGMMVTPNDALDFDTVSLIAPDFGFEVENVARTSAQIVQDVSFGEMKAERTLRPPVVTVMGHVDHGKTSLLDAIRKADVASGEAGGITQHVGAYKVTLEDGNVVTFIDTPGHEAFTAMRARGANATDIVVLVVAADDGVMHQTIEAISHAKAAGVPIIVAVNKIDKPGANVAKIKQQLTEYELVAEEWGGTTIFCEVSALKKTGIKELLEQLHVQAEVMELKANPKRSATGIVVESRLERGRGIVATMLIKDGSMTLGQNICAGATYGRVRAMFNDRGQTIKEAGPSDPIEVLGLNAAPRAGDTFDICKDEATAEALAKKRQEESLSSIEVPKAKVSLEELFSKVQTGDVKELPIILKTDMVGSSEALRGMLEKTTSEKVKIKVIHSAVGGITESDVLLASSSKGLIIGFNVRPEPGAATLAKSQGVEIKSYSIIYEVIDDVKKAMGGLLAPTIVEKTLGHAEVRDIFSIPKMGTIAGCSVLDGKIFRTSLVRLLRDSRIVYEGKISSLKRFKDDVKEVATGYECGIAIENYNDLKVGDVIEAFEKQSVATEL